MNKILISMPIPFSAAMNNLAQWVNEGSLWNDNGGLTETFADEIAERKRERERE